MTKQKRRQDVYKFDVERQDFVPNKENPEKIFITISTEYEGEEIRFEDLKFDPRQVATGAWEKVIVAKIDRKIDEINARTEWNVPDMEGETLENKGGNDTPSVAGDYPDRQER